MTIKGGSTVGILGMTGSGKSTLVSLLTKLYEPGENSGTITVSGTDIRKLKASSVRRNIGIVLQEPFLFSRTLRENIGSTFDDPASREEEIRRAAKSACLDELCQKFGTSIIDNDGTLDRVALSKLVFEGENAKANLASLNETTHKYVFEETKKLIDQYLMDGKAAVVIDAPALFSSKLFVDACDFIISALCDRDVRIERIMKRDNISIERAQARINSQPSDDFFIENSDYHILNCAKNDETYAQLFAILKEQNICK
jgi:dephospho-CoA kinase